MLSSVVGLARPNRPLASGEKVSQGSLEPLFQVRILARQPVRIVGAREVCNRVPDRIAAVILAAGAGTRMRSSLPKPLHPLCGRPMIDYVLDATGIPSLDQTIIVLSPVLAENETLRAHLGRRLGDRLSIAEQRNPRGTGDALRCAMPLLDEVERVVVLFADHPLLTDDRIAELSMSLHRDIAAISLLTCVVDDASGYGRIDRGGDGRIRRVVERKDDDPADRSGPTEINSGMMAVEVAWLQKAIGLLTPSPATGEYYLTQLVELAVSEGRAVTSVRGDVTGLVGVNDRADLAHAESILQARIQREHMLSGVTIVSPSTTVIEHGVEIGPDTTILPGCLIRSRTVIGAECEIGPQAVLTRATVGDRCRITASFVTDSGIQSDSDVGPFSHVRGGAAVSSGVHIGNFAEIKNSTLAAGVRMGHVSYVGDASIGERTNIGAGAVTCNFDGANKHRTVVGADVFIGSDTMLVAPVTIGDRAATGAGSVVTRDVESGSRVAGVPARPIVKNTKENAE
jgi:bifunctional UDP-N-acetylglucosamine pyrophosphorylase / glucosamine-1-phosphate N-acetyltransferase